MKRTTFFYCLLLTACCLLAVSCAQIVNPTGGPKDITPPKVVKYIPDSAARNFKSGSIAIFFNEFVVLKDIQGQLIISPPVEKMPDVKLKNNRTLVLEFKEPLKENTTYTINFGNSITDYTEGNVKENFQYVLSTGNFIDSLSLSGQVRNAFDLKNEKGVLVMLYSDLSDSAPYKKIPDYFSKTAPDGTYKINNVRAGKYRAFALKDANSNYKYDSEEESIAFADSVIDLKKNISLNFFLFKEEPKKQRLKKAFAAGYGQIGLVFKKPAPGLEIRPLNTKPKVELAEYSSKKDTVMYWFDGVEGDSLKLKLNASVLDTTVVVRLITKEMMKKTGRGEKLGLKIAVNAGKDMPLDLNKDLRASFNHPVVISTSRTSEIRLTTLSGKEPNCTDTTITSPAPVFWKIWAANCSWKSDSSYRLLIPPKTFTDIFGLTNDTVKAEFKTHEEKYYGSLKTILRSSASTGLLQLLDEKENVVREDPISRSLAFDYSYLHPGKYKLKLIYDSNGDGKWSAGNYNKHIQPEKVIYYPGDITIRSNWDLEIEWKIDNIKQK